MKTNIRQVLNEYNDFQNESGWYRDTEERKCYVTVFMNVLCMWQLPSPTLACLCDDEEYSAWEQYSHSGETYGYTFYWDAFMK